MLLKRRSRSFSFRNMSVACTLVLATVMLGIGVSRSTKADDAPPPPAPPANGRSEPIAEELDIFRERQRELIRQERKEAQKKPRKKTPVPTFSDVFSFKPTPASDVGDGIGAIGRISHLIGPTFGRTGSITPAEVMPYSLNDENFIFADVRGFITNSSRAGGNAGLGYRYLSEDYNAWGGASLWYDADDSTSKLFQQIGLSFEGLIQRFELRSNVYLPITSTQTISNTVSGAQISGTQILFGRNIDMGTAMRGVDAEFGYSLPVRKRHVVRAFVGGYFFDANNVSSVSGVRLRAEAVINNSATAQVMYTNDKLFGSNVMVGVSLQLPFGNKHPTAGWKQHTPSPFRFVERNYNVIVDRWNNGQGLQAAVDPATGQAYKVEQVYDPPSGTNAWTPDGTAARPFATVAQAQAAGGNVIIVQNGSVLSDPIVLSTGQHLFGQGNFMPVLAIAGGGSVQLPIAQLADQPVVSSQQPIFENVNGSAVTVASNTEVAGFVFSGTSDHGIVGTNASNVSLHDLKFLATGADSIHLTDSSGTVMLDRIQINGSSGNGIVLDGGDANITYLGAGTSITTQGDGFTLKNLTGGAVNIGDLTLKNTGGAGLRMDTVGTSVTFDSLSASQTTGPAVAISGNTGTVSTVNGVSTNVYNTYTFNDFTTITSPKGAGFTINGTDAIINLASLNVTSTSGSSAVSLVNNPSSAITINSLVLNTNNGTGLFAAGLDLLNVNGGTISSVNAPAINIQGSTINMSLKNVSVNGGLFGIGLSQSSGIFNILGTGTYASGGTIQNTTTGLVVNSFGTANINWVDFISNGVGVQSTKSAELNLQNVRIGASTTYGIDSMDDSTLTLRNSILNANGNIGGGSIRIRADALGTFQSLISNNSITDVNGTAIQYASLPSGAGASVASSITSNVITGTRGGAPVIAYGWTGPESIQVSNNTIYVLGSNSTAVLIQDSSPTDSMVAQVNGNTISFQPSASAGTGISVIAAGTSQLAIAQNTVDFKAAGGIGTRYALSGTSTDYIASNVITDEAGGATGMLFDSVAANSRLQIEANTINLLATDLTTHQGIIFTSVVPTIQFTGTVNNLIYNATSLQSLFSIPVNSATGGFYINGSLE